jgi:hypothetical protein
MKNTVVRVYKNTRYALLTAVASFLFFTGALWLPNISLIERFVASDSQTYVNKITFLFSLYGSVFSSHTLYSATVAVVIAVLSGVNVSLLVYYIRRAQKASTGMKRTSVTSLGGLIVGILGVGCAACGSVVVTALLALFGVGGLLFLLPFGGAEFGVLAIILLLTANYYLLKHIGNPLVCRV